MKKNLLAVFLVALFGMIIGGCGGGGSATGTTQTPDNSIPAGKGAYDVSLKLYDVNTPSPTAKTADTPTVKPLKALSAKTVADGGASGGGGEGSPLTNLDAEFCKRVDHVYFWFTDVNGSNVMDQTLNVQNGVLSGRINVIPGSYELHVSFYTKTDICLFTSSTFVEIIEGMAAKSSLVLERPDVIGLTAEYNNVPGTYEDGAWYNFPIWFSVMNGYSYSAGARYIQSENKFKGNMLYLTDVNSKKASISIRDKSDTTYYAQIDVDVLTAIDIIEAGGTIIIDWPESSTFEFDIIFAGSNAGYLKATNEFQMNLPIRGHENQELNTFSLENLTSSAATTSELFIRVWDADYLTNLYMVRSDLDYTLFEPTHFPCTVISNQGGSKIFSCATDIHTDSKQKVVLKIKGDVSLSYPQTEMLNVMVIGAKTLDTDGKSVPFLGTHYYGRGVDSDQK
ncbi:hypothetical protein HGA64_00435 [Candidatus Falkowbacteria bacterium]|nr:hypothetical protein [Candidatus Falkowbacteria bacterium]